MVHLPKNQNKLCSAPIQNQTIGFKCYDCEIKNDYQIFCKNCFLKANHENHATIFVSSNSGFCDCGDIQIIKSQGFCSDHSQFQNLGVN